MIDQFKCTNDEFDEIYKAVNNCRGKEVTLSRVALQHLLDDHAELQHTIQQGGIIALETAADKAEDFIDRLLLKGAWDADAARSISMELNAALSKGE